MGFYNRDLTLYNPVITICTTSLTFNNSTFCPHSVFMCFVWISEQTAIMSLCNINWPVFITKTECFYCAVRTGSWDIVMVNVWLKDCAMSQAVGRCPVTLKAGVWFQVSPSEICGGQSGNVAGFSLSTSVSPLSLSFHQCSILIILYMFLPEGQMGEAWEPPKKQCWFGSQEPSDRKVLLLGACRVNVISVRLVVLYFISQ